MTHGNTASGTEVEQRNHSGPVGKLGRDHVNFWKSRLRKRTYEWQGKQVEIPEWQVRIAHLGRREWFNLGTPNEAAAASKARDIYRSLTGKGWTPTLAIYKPDMEVTGDGCTVGEFLEQVQATSSLKAQTFAIYARKFRTLVAGVCKIDGGTAKHDYVNGGYKAWLAKVNGVKLEKLTPDRINEWKVRELKAVSDSPAQRKQTSTTLRSIMLSAKSLFTPEIRRHLTVKLPSPLPFDGVTLPEIGKSRYKGLGGNLTAALLAEAAQNELANGNWELEPKLFKRRFHWWVSDKHGNPRSTGLKCANAEETKRAQAILTAEKEKPADPCPRPEEYKAFLLGFGAGLRRDEIDGLEWANVRWDENIIRVETSAHSGTKSDTSEADITVDPGLLEILKGFMPRPGTKASKFVIESPVAHRVSATYHHYRCDRIFKNLIAWLSSKGIKARNPIHALRKEFGSQICKQAGIFAASVALRHSNITITRDHYVDDKASTAVFHVSKLLQPKAA